VTKKQISAVKKEFPHWKYIGWKPFSYAGFFPVAIFLDAEHKVMYVNTESKEVVQGTI
jgi:hypothetical protein